MSRMFRLTEEQYADLVKSRKAFGAKAPATNQGGSQTLAPIGQTEPKAIAVSRGKYPSGQEPAKAPPGPSQIHIRMRQQIQQAGLPPPIEEYYHIKGRDFRLDFAWPDRKIGVEVQGMAHRIKGKFHADIEKRALAMLQGWRILEVSGDTVRDERGIGWLKQLLEIER